MRYNTRWKRRARLNPQATDGRKMPLMEETQDDSLRQTHIEAGTTPLVAWLEDL